MRVLVTRLRQLDLRIAGVLSLLVAAYWMSRWFGYGPSWLHILAFGVANLAWACVVFRLAWLSSGGGGRYLLIASSLLFPVGAAANELWPMPAWGGVEVLPSYVAQVLSAMAPLLLGLGLLRSRSVPWWLAWSAIVWALARGGAAVLLSINDVVGAGARLWLAALTLSYALWFVTGLWLLTKRSAPGAGTVVLSTPTVAAEQADQADNAPGGLDCRCGG